MHRNLPRRPIPHGWQGSLDIGTRQSHALPTSPVQGSQPCSSHDDNSYRSPGHNIGLHLSWKLDGFQCLRRQLRHHVFILVHRSDSTSSLDETKEHKIWHISPQQVPARIHPQHDSMWLHDCLVCHILFSILSPGERFDHELCKCALGWFHNFACNLVVCGSTKGI